MADTIMACEARWKKHCAKLEAEIAELKARLTPQPIETAPKDGKTILLYERSIWRYGYFSNEQGRFKSVVGVEFSPSHWLPRPEVLK